MKKYMEYKGYTGSVELSEIFFGKVLGIRSLISYEGHNVDELRKDFQDGIDDYLATCAAEGIEPETPSKPLAIVSKR